jgi:hypothetical protein
MVIGLSAKDEPSGWYLIRKRVLFDTDDTPLCLWRCNGYRYRTYAQGEGGLRLQGFLPVMMADGALTGITMTLNHIPFADFNALLDPSTRMLLADA